MSTSILEFFQKLNFNPDFVYNGTQLCEVPMRFEVVQNLNDEAFRRLTGVKRETFAKIVEIVVQALPGNKSRKSRPNRLSV
jgi:hypothetical protein